jgi:four helix bundle protein
MATIKSFKELSCWKFSRDVSVEVFNAVQNSPHFKTNFSFKDQILRSAGSIMDNIAEGFGRGGNTEFVLFLGYANGSCSELKSQLVRAEDFGYIDTITHKSIEMKIDKIEGMIIGLRKYLQSSPYYGSRFEKEKKLKNKIST